jgi:adenine-specific DNA methylase
LFSKRQLFSLSLILNQIELITDPIIKDLMRFTFSATLNKTNLTFSSTRGRIESRGNSGIMHRYRYWIPPQTIDLNVWEQFEQKFKGTAKFKIETNTVIGDFYQENFSIFDFSATDLTGISSESVDYIYTDPPYGQHIAYLDLSTMWNAWLGFEVSDNARELEAIEGGDLKKSKETYINLLSNSIREMFRVLKFDRWMSIVFAHKDPAYWDAIVKSAQEAGFEYVNSSVQHSTTPSLHKKKNPLTVLSGELVLNFRKVNNPKTIAISKVGIDILQIIKEVAEMTIVKSSGASTEDIYNALIPKLLENGLLTQVKKQIDDITPLLKEEFNFSELDHLWRIRTNTKIGCFIPLEDRIRFYL